MPQISGTKPRSEPPENCGFQVSEELEPRHFSFNTHVGACPDCDGLGQKWHCDAALLVELGLIDGAQHVAHLLLFETANAENATLLDFRQIPGFVTDLFGLLLLFPPSRKVFKDWITAKFKEWSANTEIEIRRFP